MNKTYRSMCAALWPALVLISTAAVPAAGHAAQDAGAPPVLVEFRAVTDAGTPVVDLKAADVSLKVGGRARDITSLELVQGRGAGMPATPGGGAVAAPFATNVVMSVRGRDLLIVVDEDSLASGRDGPFLDSIRQLVSTLTPDDRLRLLSLRQGGANTVITDQAGGGQAALAGLSGRSTPSETANELVCRTAVALQRLQTVLTGFSGESPPTVIIISAGFGAPPTGGRSTPAPGDSPCPVLRTSDFFDVGTAAQAVHASVFMLYAVDATVSTLSRETLETGVETLAGALGAETIRVAASPQSAMTRIAGAPPAYYLAAFEPEPGERNGSRQRVEVHVAREGVKVRARSDVVMLKAGTPAKAKAPKPDEMLRVPTIYRDLPLRAAGFASRGDSSDKVRLVVLFEPVDSTVKLTAAAVGLYDAKGKLTRWTAEASDLARTPLMAGIIVARGAYRMRVAATDSSGRTGTVDSQVEAQLVEAGPVRLSTMLLGTSAADGTFVPRLQFSTEPGAFGYLEIYGVPKDAAVTVQLEVAPSADAPAVASSDVQLAQGPADDIRIAYSGFAIDAMPPGDYVMRALVRVNNQDVGRAVRTLRKTK